MCFVLIEKRAPDSRQIPISMPVRRLFRCERSISETPPNWDEGAKRRRGVGRPWRVVAAAGRACGLWRVMDRRNFGTLSIILIRLLYRYVNLINFVVGKASPYSTNQSPDTWPDV
jgi:hypothetical protein